MAVGDYSQEQSFAKLWRWLTRGGGTDPGDGAGRTSPPYVSITGVADVDTQKSDDTITVYGVNVSGETTGNPSDASRIGMYVDAQGRLYVRPGDDVVTASSTTAQVNGSATFTGAEFSTLGYSAITVHVNETQNGTLTVSNRDASSNVLRASTFSTIGGTPFFIALTELDSRMLISWANGSGSASTGQIETIGRSVPASPTQTRLDSSLVPASIATATKNMERYVGTKGTPASFTVATSGSTTLLAANTTNRLGYTISHTSGTGDVFLRFDGVAPTATVYEDRIQPGETLKEMGKGIATGAILALASAATTVVSITETTF